jgi:competence protein ComGE
MLLKNKGFFLIELLLSLSAWFMLSLIFIPLLIDIKNQALDLEIEKQSYQLLYEELEALAKNGHISSNYSISKNGMEYQISWKDTADSVQKEVCVKVENSLHVEKEKCVLSE